MTTSITLNIQDPNGNSDGTPSSNDSDTIEILRRQGSSGAWTVAKTLTDTDLSAGQQLYTITDTGLQDNTSYFYKTRTTRGATIEESPVIIGPIIGKSLDTLAYPNNTPSNLDGTTYAISTEPIFHFKASHAIQETGGIYSEAGINSNRSTTEGKASNFPDFTNLSKRFSGYNLLMGSKSSSYLCRDDTLDIAFFEIYGRNGLDHSNPTQGFQQLCNAIGTSIEDPNTIALNDGYTYVMVLPSWCGTRPHYRDNYSTLKLKFNTNLRLPHEWESLYSTTDGLQEMSQKHMLYNPRNITDGQYYHNDDVTHDGTTYFGSPNGYKWDTFPGFYGDGAGSVFTLNTSYMDPNSLGPIFIERDREDRDEYFLHEGARHNMPEQAGSLLNVFVIRHHEDGQGTKYYMNGNLVHSNEHTQYTLIQNAGGHDSNIFSHVGSDGSQNYWGKNGYTSLKTASNGEQDQGITFHIPTLIDETFGSFSYAHSTQRYCEEIFIPSALPDSEFTTLINYIQNEYSGKLNPQANDYIPQPPLSSTVNGNIVSFSFTAQESHWSMYGDIGDPINGPDNADAVTRYAVIAYQNSTSSPLTRGGGGSSSDGFYTAWQEGVGQKLFSPSSDAQHTTVPGTSSSYGDTISGSFDLSAVQWFDSFQGIVTGIDTTQDWSIKLVHFYTTTSGSYYARDHETLSIPGVINCTGDFSASINGTTIDFSFDSDDSHWPNQSDMAVEGGPIDTVSPYFIVARATSPHLTYFSAEDPVFVYGSPSKQLLYYGNSLANNPSSGTTISGSFDISEIKWKDRNSNIQTGVDANNSIQLQLAYNIKVGANTITRSISSQVTPCENYNDIDLLAGATTFNTTITGDGSNYLFTGDISDGEALSNSGSITDPDIQIYLGDVLVITNNSDTNHPLEILHGSSGANYVTKSGNIYTFTPQEKGTYDYFCTNHPTSMKGRIFVE